MTMRPSGLVGVVSADPAPTDPASTAVLPAATAGAPPAGTAPSSVPVRGPASVGLLERRAYGVCLALLLVAHAGLYGWLLYTTDLLPYVYDNNESFSSLWHAYNLYHFDFFGSWGLTDESFSPHADAHPYPHTHQGNFPRLFAFVIFVLGARSIESQILVTTFSIGTVAVFFAFHFLSRLAGPAFALVAGLVLLTDYVFYAQWHVVTYRVWHLFFLFSTLLCARGIGDPHRRRWLALTFANYLALFYYELIFVAFVSIFAGLYTAWCHWRRPRTVLVAWIVQGAAGALSMAILFVQLAQHLGMDVFLEDINLTYFARNSGASGVALQRQLGEFYDRHNIVFWYNIVDVSNLRSAWAFIEQVYELHFEIYTPFFVLLVLIVLGGWLLGLLGRPRHLLTPRWLPSIRRRPSRGARRSALPGWLARSPVLMVGRWSPGGVGLRIRTPLGSARMLLVAYTRVGGTASMPPTRVGASVVARALATLAVLFLAASYFLVTVLRDRAFLGFEITGASFAARTAGLGWLGIVALGAAMAALLYATLRDWRPIARLAAGRVSCAALVLYGAAAYVRMHGTLYNQNFADLWYNRLSTWAPTWIDLLALVAATSLAVAFTLLGTRRVLGEGSSAHIAGVLPYLLLGATALGMCYVLAPGYVLSGYVRRSAPLLVFLADVAIAVALYVMLVAVARAVGLAGCLRAAGRADARACGDRQSRIVTPSGAVPSGAVPSGVVPSGVVPSGVVPSGAATGGAQARVGHRFGRPRVPHQSVAAFYASAGLAASVVGLACFVTGYWIHVQRSLMDVLPPTHFAVFKRLAEPPYAGASFVVTMYGAPVAAYTGEWSYIDTGIAKGKVMLTDDGFDVGRDLRYLWFADKRTNPDYARPDFFLCTRSQTIVDAFYRARGLVNADGACSASGLVRRAGEARQPFLRYELMAEDESPWSSWAIVKLDWDYPPYLLPLGGSDGRSRVGVAARQAAEGTILDVTYAYAHQEGRPEAGTIVRAYGRAADWSRCLLGEADGGTRIVLPPGVRGEIWVAVAPGAGTKAGPEFTSEPLLVGDAAARGTSPCR